MGKKSKNPKKIEAKAKEAAKAKKAKEAALESKATQEKKAVPVFQEQIDALKTKLASTGLDDDVRQEKPLLEILEGCTKNANPRKALLRATHETVMQSRNIKQETTRYPVAVPYWTPANPDPPTPAQIKAQNLCRCASGDPAGHCKWEEAPFHASLVAANAT